MRPVTRSTSPIRLASTSASRCGPRPIARCAPIERRRRPGCTGRGSRLWARAWRWRPDPRPTIAISRSSLIRATSPTVRDAVPVQLRGRHLADAPQPLDGQRMEEGELAVGRHDQQPVGLGDAARDLREELGARDADGDRQAHLLADGGAQPRGDRGRACRRSRSMPRTSRNASSIDSALDDRRRVGEDVEHRPAGRGVGRHPRRAPRSRADTACAPAGRPSRSARRRPAPRSSPTAPPRRRR